MYPLSVEVILFNQWVEGWWIGGNCFPNENRQCYLKLGLTQNDRNLFKKILLISNQSEWWVG